MSIADRGCYLDGSLEGTLAAATTASNLELLIGARNGEGKADLFIAAYVESVAFYDFGISAYIAALTTAMNAL